MINALDETLKALLKRELPTALAEQVQISFATPDGQFPPQSVTLPAVDLFLYDVRENIELRSNEVYIERRGDGTATRMRAPMRVDFSYLITAWPSESVPDPSEDEHRILGEVLRVLLRYRTLPGDTLTPEFRVSVNGTELPLRAKADIISLCVLNDVAATSMFTLTLLSWDSVEMKVKWIDDDLFTEGNRVEITMGYRDCLEKLFTGEITGLEPAFPNEEPPTLTIRGYDQCHRLMGKHQTRTFLQMKDSDIAGQIAGDWGLKPDVKDMQVVIEYVLQHNQSDFEFLQERALLIGYEMVVTDTTLHFRPRQNQGSPTVTLNREVELLDFSARLTTTGQVEEVIVQGWNPKSKEEFVAHARAGDERQMGGSASGPATVRQAFAGTGGVSVDLPVLSQAEADQLANQWFGEMALSYVEGQGVCIGRPDLHPGTLVDIQGLGRRFSGAYYVTSAEHSYRPKAGYRTAFTVRRNAT